MDRQQSRHGDHLGEDASPSGIRRIKLNVGGKLFETTTSTLVSGGPDSVLAAFCSSYDGATDESDLSPIFIDRDPEIFSVLLSLLRTSRLPSTARHRFTTQELAEEALYYGVEPLLRTSMAPHPLSGPDASLAATVRPAADALATALAAGQDDGSIWVAHGGQISAYDWALTHAGTIRTHVNCITSLRRAWGDVAAVGSYIPENPHQQHDTISTWPGLHFYDVLSSGRHVGSVHWRDHTDPRVYKAQVASVATADADDPTIYAAFECPHRENAILAVDKQTLQVASEIGRQSGSSIKNAVATKLSVVPSPGSSNLVFASAVTSGAFGYSGYMRLWDPRREHTVWETTEPGAGSSSNRFGDSFSAADVDPHNGRIYKVCWKSGDVGFADLRMLSTTNGGGGDPWVYLEERSAGLRDAGGGQGAVVCCYKGQVFVGREGGLEAWTKVEDDSGGVREEGEEQRGRKGWTEEMRRNYVDREEDAKRGTVRMMEGGGDRLFVCREDVEGVEVWESSELSGAVAAVEL